MREVQKQTEKKKIQIQNSPSFCKCVALLLIKCLFCVYSIIMF